MLGHGAAWKAWTQYADQHAHTHTHSLTHSHTQSHAPYRYFNSVPVGTFVGVWPVPPAPTSVASQTLFFWNGVEGASCLCSACATLGVCVLEWSVSMRGVCVCVSC